MRKGDGGDLFSHKSVHFCGFVRAFQRSEVSIVFKPSADRFSIPKFLNVTKRDGSSLFSKRKSVKRGEKASWIVGFVVCEVVKGRYIS